MTYTPTLWTSNDDITAAKLNNLELQYDSAKTDFGAITVTVTVAVDGSSIHAIGADYLVPIGSTTAETTINSAIDAAVAAGGGEVLLLEGTYVIDGQIKLKDKITLSGMGANTVIKLKNALNADLIMITHNTTAAPGNKNMVVKDLTVDGNKANNTAGDQNGIYFLNCTDTSARTIVRNCFVRNFRTNGIIVNSSKGVIVDKCVASNCAAAGIGSNTSTLQLTNNTVTNCLYGILINGGTDCVIASTDGFGNTSGIRLAGSTTRTAITGCTLYSNTNGLEVNASTYNSFVGNTFRNNSAYGLLAESSAHYLTCMGNSFFSNGVGLKISSSNYAVISANTITGSIADGVYLLSSGYAELANNVVYKNGTQGMWLYGSSRNVIANNNVSANSQASDGSHSNIAITSASSENVVTGNRVHKGGGANYPPYGLYIGAGCLNCLVTANNLKDGGSSLGLDNVEATTDLTAWMAAGNKVS